MTRSSSISDRVTIANDVTSRSSMNHTHDVNHLPDLSHSDSPNPTHNGEKLRFPRLFYTSKKLTRQVLLMGGHHESLSSFKEPVQLQLHNAFP